MFVYAVSSNGTLTQVAGSPFQARVSGVAPAVDAAGRFVFVGGYNQPLVAAMAVNPATGALTPVPGSPFENGPSSSGSSPIFGTTSDPSGKFLLLADYNASKITVFSIDQNSGALTNVNGSPTKVIAKAPTASSFRS